MLELPSYRHSFELRVTLRHVEPAVWRSVVVPADIPLAALHEVLQVAFGWQGGHLHDFEVSGIRFGIVDDEFEDDVLAVDEQAAPLGAVARQGSQFVYRYDFGDDWEHDIVVERMQTAEEALIECTGGARACPPQDCGGAPGYAELLKAFADPEHPQHAAAKKALGPRYSPEAFDLDDTNAQLAALTEELLGDADPSSPSS